MFYHVLGINPATSIGFWKYSGNAPFHKVWNPCTSPTFCARLPLMHESLLRKQQKSQGKQTTKIQCKTCRRAWNWGVLPSNQWLKVLRWCNKIWDCNCYCNNCWAFSWSPLSHQGVSLNSTGCWLNIAPPSIKKRTKELHDCKVGESWIKYLRSHR